jgi:hypothetical protein
MPEHRDVYAYFWVHGYTGTAEEVSTLLGLAPTTVRRLGETSPHGRPVKFAAWEFASPLPRGQALLQDYLESLLVVLEPRIEAVRKLRAEFPAGINCVGYYYGSNPGLHLSASLLNRLAKLQLDVDFDLYNYGETDAV